MKNGGVRKIYYSNYFYAALNKISDKAKMDFLKKESFFIKNPFHPSLKTHKLHGKYKDYYAFQINYQYRLMFKFLNDNEVIFVNIGTHEIYK